MGLDIFAYRVKNSIIEKNNISVNSGYHDIMPHLKELQLQEFCKKTNKLVKKLNNDFVTNYETYKESYLNFINSVRKQIPLYRAYGYKLEKLGFDYYNNKLIKILSPTDAKNVLDKETNNYIEAEDAYFRKVNFIYAFFQSVLVDECCVVDKTKIQQLIDVCKDVLEHKGDEDYADEHLPTMGGFFFGNTDYNDWYWNDVKDCLKKMTKLHKSLKDDDLVFWYFSW